MLITDKKANGSYCPLLYYGIDKNLRQYKIWNHIEVHAIYGLFCTLCMSKEGLQHLINHISADDSNLFDPLFMAQYLLIPVNTIVKFTLHPWMMKNFIPDPPKPCAMVRPTEKTQAKQTKGEIYLKYILLVDIMNIVKTYGRKQDYNFCYNEKLKEAQKVFFSDKSKTDNAKLMLSIDSFMTIWLVALPEKFKE